MLPQDDSYNTHNIFHDTQGNTILHFARNGADQAKYLVIDFGGNMDLVYLYSCMFFVK